MAQVNGRLWISDDADLIQECFEVWQNALLDVAIWEGRFWRLPESRIVFRNQPHAKLRELGERTALGIDPLGHDWVVQINRATKPGDPNVTSAIATDESGAIYLIRQGRLQSNNLNSDPVGEAEFRRLSGLLAVDVVNGNTANVPRDWYVVCRLDTDADNIRYQIGDFVDTCARVREGADAVESKEDREVRVVVSGGEERGGHYIVRPRQNEEERRVDKLQGEVWQELKLVLDPDYAKVDKLRHCAGYEVDATIETKNEKFLVEIKSDYTAADVYCGVGQLAIYAKLMPSLADHQPLLLLPQKPNAFLVEAVEKVGVTIYTYSIDKLKVGFDVQFSREFLRLFNVE